MHLVRTITEKVKQSWRLALIFPFPMADLALTDAGPEQEGEGARPIPPEPKSPQPKGRSRRPRIWLRS